MTPTSRFRFFPLTLGCITAIYLITRVALFARFQPAGFSDTQSYVDVFASGFSPRWFGNERPFSYPLLLWAAHYNFSIVKCFQLLASTSCWLAGAWMLSGLFKARAARLLVFVTLLLTSFTLDIIQWDLFMLTESLSIALLMLLLALFVLWQSGPAPRKWLPPAFAAVAIVFSFLRDVNAFIPPIFALLLVLPLTRRRKQLLSPDAAAEPAPRREPGGKLPLLIALIMIIIPLLQQIDITLARRHWYNFENFLNLRVMVDGQGETAAEHFAWLHRRFELPPEALRRAGGNYENLPPMTPEYREWIDTQGLRAWKSFLLHHPGWVLRAYFAAPCIYGESGMGYFLMYMPRWRGTAWEFPMALHRASHAALDPLLRSRLLIFLLCGGLCLALGGAYRDGSKSALWSVFAVLSYTGAVMLFLAKFGDGIEDWRHALLGLVAVYLALCLLAGILLDFLIGRIARR